jgi:hypothetical protein
MTTRSLALLLVLASLPHHAATITVVGEPRSGSDQQLLSTEWLARMADKAQLSKESRLTPYNLRYPCPKDQALLDRMGPDGMDASLFQSMVTTSKSDGELAQKLEKTLGKDGIAAPPPASTDDGNGPSSSAVAGASPAARTSTAAPKRRTGEPSYVFERGSAKGARGRGGRALDARANKEGRGAATALRRTEPDGAPSNQDADDGC